ncbi:hypothetical protein F5I97DRAFT_976781 [Phlebopus sp. FC_14]|nr:hypothetical protein F5I97DRAFT_976781 [Phlebopus sp. FC_14]
MTHKRVLVPAALHAELTEYTNLIRVLRTSRTLDLTSHLLEHAAQQRQEEDNDEREDAGKGKGSGGGRTRDTWTPWPLLDFPVPEWRFDEEMKVLGDTVLRQITHRDVQANSQVDADNDDGEGEEDTELNPLSPQSTRLLVEHLASFLVRILNLMADQRPSTAGSMQNRLWAMNWQDVMSTLAVHGAVDQGVLTRAEKRLARIYGASDSRAIERMRVAAAARSKFEGAISRHDDVMLQPPIHRPPKRRKKKERRVVSKATINSDTDDDDDDEALV